LALIFHTTSINNFNVVFGFVSGQPLRVLDNVYFLSIKNLR